MMDITISLYAVLPDQEPKLVACCNYPQYDEPLPQFVHRMDCWESQVVDVLDDRGVDPTLDYVSTGEVDIYLAPHYTVEDGDTKWYGRAVNQYLRFAHTVFYARNPTGEYPI